MRKNGVIVPPLSTKNIYTIAETIRSAFSKVMKLPLCVPIDRIYEVLPALIEGFSFEIVTRAEIGNDLFSKIATMERERFGIDSFSREASDILNEIALDRIPGWEAS